jgi:hypothetical protein
VLCVDFIPLISLAFLQPSLLSRFARVQPRLRAKLYQQMSTFRQSVVFIKDRPVIQKFQFLHCRYQLLPVISKPSSQWSRFQIEAAHMFVLDHLIEGFLRVFQLVLRQVYGCQTLTKMQPSQCMRMNHEIL